MKGQWKKCPVRGGRGVKTDWKPVPGQDPMLRQYRCRSCRRLFHVILTEEQIKHAKLQKR